MARRKPNRRTGVRTRFRHQKRTDQLIRPQRKKHKSVFQKIRETIARRREKVSLLGRARRIAAARKLARAQKRTTK